MNEFDELLKSEEPVKKKENLKKQKQKQKEVKKCKAKQSKIFKWGMITSVVVLSLSTIWFGLLYAGVSIQLDELSKRSGVATVDKTEKALEVYRKVADAGDQQDIKESQIANLKQQLKTTLEEADKAKKVAGNQQTFIASVLSETQATDVVSKFFKLYFSTNGIDVNTDDLLKFFRTEQELLALGKINSPMKELSSKGELATTPTVLFSGMRGSVNDYFVIVGFKVKDKIVPQVYRMSIDLDGKIKVVHYLGSIDVNYGEIVKSLDEVKANGNGQKETTKESTKEKNTSEEAKSSN